MYEGVRLLVWCGASVVRVSWYVWRSGVVRRCGRYASMAKISDPVSGVSREMARYG